MVDLFRCSCCTELVLHEQFDSYLWVLYFQFFSSFNFFSVLLKFESFAVYSALFVQQLLLFPLYQLPFLSEIFEIDVHILILYYTLNLAFTLSHITLYIETCMSCRLKHEHKQKRFGKKILKATFSS